MSEKDRSGYIDYVLGKLASRKLLAFGLSTAFFVAEMLNSEQWLMIAVAYVGAQGFVDVVNQWRRRV